MLEGVTVGLYRHDLLALQAGLGLGDPVDRSHDLDERLVEGAFGGLDLGEVVIRPNLGIDVGPAIDDEARDLLSAHVERMEKEAKVLHRSAMPEATKSGTFFAPTLVEIDDIGVLQREVFGPVLHVLRYRSKDLKKTIDAINATGYGLTMGLHSRIDSRARKLAEISGAGNFYINRNMIGAAVGVQPFGDRGLSGTGP